MGSGEMLCFLMRLEDVSVHVRDVADYGRFCKFFMRSPEGAKHTELPKEAPKNLLLCSVTRMYSKFIAFTCDSKKFRAVRDLTRDVYNYMFGT